MAEHLWQIERLDRDAYLGRIGVSGQPASRAALNQLLEAHVRTFTFDNVDVLLDQHLGVGLDVVQSKFVGRGRGGYWFEHATLFSAALERLGYTVERRLVPRRLRPVQLGSVVVRGRQVAHNVVTNSRGANVAPVLPNAVPVLGDGERGHYPFGRAKRVP